jgi:hypothetical protein
LAFTLQLLPELCVLGVKSLNLWLLCGTQWRSGLFHDHLESGKSAALLDFIGLPFLEGRLLVRLQKGNDFRQYLVIDFLKFRSELRIICNGATTSFSTSASSLAGIESTPATATLALASESSFAAGARRATETFNRLLNLFERCFDDWPDGPFLISGDRYLGLREEFLDGIHRVGLLAARPKVTTTKERRGKASSAATFVLCR